MKVFKILEPVSSLIFKSAEFLDRSDFKVKDSARYSHPQEDYLLASDRFPIFVVADGVSLGFDKNGKYPNPSGAGEVARIFCKTVIAEVEKVYSKITVSDLKKVFAKANIAVGEYNRSQGRIKSKLNYHDVDLFATTAAFMVIKAQWVYWVSLCDSYVMRFDKNSKLKFSSPGCWSRLRRNLPANWAEILDNEREKIIRKVHRNGIDENGKLIGYGVVTGEKAAEKYLSYGRFVVTAGDIIAVLTDGFENYVALPEFINLFKEWPADLENRVKKMTAGKSLINPQKFGLERSLIAVKF